MKASQITDYGGAEVHRLNEVERPTAGTGQVVVEVHAAGVNPFDWKLRAGYLKETIPLQFPATLGGDCSGTVAQVGAGVSGVSVGDEIYGLANATGGAGSFAEFVAVTAGQLAPKPAELSHAEAAGLPLAGASAYQAVVDELGVRNGEKVLIHGGAGGIGSHAIQIAKHRGAQVATTASSQDAAFLRGLGADEVIDYRTESFAEKRRAYDAVLDTVGGEVTTQSLKVLKPGGKLASLMLSGPLAGAEHYDLTIIPISAKATTDRLQKLTALVRQGVLEVTVDKTFPLALAGEALTYLQKGHPTGKVVITVK